MTQRDDSITAGDGPLWLLDWPTDPELERSFTELDRRARDAGDDCSKCACRTNRRKQGRPWWLWLG